MTLAIALSIYLIGIAVFLRMACLHDLYYQDSSTRFFRIAAAALWPAIGFVIGCVDFYEFMSEKE